MSYSISSSSTFTPINAYNPRASTPPPPNSPDILSKETGRNTPTKEYMVSFGCQQCRDTHQMIYATDGSIRSYNVISITGNESCTFVKSIAEAITKQLLTEKK